MQVIWRRFVLIGCLALLVGSGSALVAGDTLAPEEIPSVLSPETSATLVAPGSTDENRWRYLNHEGRWWYWLPSNRWVVWVDGRWVDPPTGGRAYVVPAPPRPFAPRPRSWYYTGRTYDGPAYYYDEFYQPYGTYSPHHGPAYPGYYYPRGHYHGHGHHHHYHHGGYYDSHPSVRVRGTIGGGSSRVRVGVGF